MIVAVLSLAVWLLWLFTVIARAVRTDEQVSTLDAFALFLAGLVVFGAFLKVQ